MKDLSEHTYLSEYTLYKLSYGTRNYYREIRIPKRNGGVRNLACPAYTLKAVQAWILRNILDKVPPDYHATAFCTGSSILHNATRHKGNNFFICIDIENFFTSIPRWKIYSFFRALGYEVHPAMILTNFCTYKGSLPQGGVTSPALSNLINIRLDKRIAAYTGLRNITYTRYADDITLSSNNPDKLFSALKTVSKIIESEGYKINREKRRLLRPGMSRKVVGITFSDDGNLGLGKKQLKLLRAKIHRLETKSLPDDEYTKLNYHVLGWLAYIRSVDEEAYWKIKDYQESVRYRSEAAATWSGAED